MARPERVELPTFWFVAKSNGFGKRPTVKRNTPLRPVGGVAGCMCLHIESLTSLVTLTRINPKFSIVASGFGYATRTSEWGKPPRRTGG
jgi:hypothetical protein